MSNNYRLTYQEKNGEAHARSYDYSRHLIPGKTDLVSRYPHIAEEWDYERNGDLKQNAINSNKKV